MDRWAHVLAGSVQQIVDDLGRLRERVGISYVTLPSTRWTNSLEAVGIVNLVLTSKITWRIRVVHRGDVDLDHDHWIWYALLPAVVNILLVTSSVGIFLNNSSALVLLAVTAIISLNIGLRNTWNLMLWLTIRHGIALEETRQSGHSVIVTDTGMAPPS